MEFTPEDLICKRVMMGIDQAGFLMIPAVTDDPISLSYLRGERPNSYMIELLQELTTEGDLIIDAGCHIGTFSVAAGLLGRHLISIDANELHVSLMQKSKAVNDIAAMKIIHRAISTNAGPVNFIENGLFGAIDFSNLNSGAVSVPTIRLDDAASLYADGRPVRFIKMDIEGAEFDAFLSAMRLLQTQEPVIWWESNGPTLALAGKTIKQTRELLESVGYRTYRVEGDRWIYAPPTQIQPEAWLDVLSLGPSDQKRFAHKIDPVWHEDRIVERCREWTRYLHHHTLNHLLEQMALHPNKLVLADVDDAARKAFAALP